MEKSRDEDNQNGQNKPKPLCDQITYKDGLYKFPLSIAHRRITLWNSEEERKIAGSAAPIIAVINEYLIKNPHMETYRSQKKSGKGQQHVPLWNTVTRRKFSGRGTPLEKNLNKYLANHPNLERYEGQDKNIPKSELPQRVNIFNEVLDRMLCGNARPYEDTLDEYLKRNPHCRIATPDDFISRKETMKNRKQIIEVSEEMPLTPEMKEDKCSESRRADIVQELKNMEEDTQSCVGNSNFRVEIQDKRYSNHLERHALPALFLNTGDVEFLFSDDGNAREVKEADSQSQNPVPLQTLEESDADQFSINESRNINSDLRTITEDVEEE